MKDNDIIKALECCSVHPMKCKKCPYNKIACCTDAHRKDALELIKFQKNYIETVKNLKAGKEVEAVKKFVETLKRLSYPVKIGNGKHFYKVVTEQGIDSIFELWQRGQYNGN